MNISRKYKNKNGYCKYEITNDEIIIEMIESYVKRKGVATFFILRLQKLSRKNGKPISLASYPQDDSISQEDLDLFYTNLGFEDCDGGFIYNKI